MSVRERIANFSGGNGSSLGKGVRGPSASPSWARKPSISSTSALSKGTATSGRVGKVNVPDVFRSATKRVDVSESLTSRGLSTSTLAEAPVGTEVEKMPTAGNTGDLSCGITGGSSSSSSAESSNGSASSAGGQSSENCASSGNKRTGSPGPGQSDGGASSLVSSSNHGSASPQMKSSSESGDGPEVRPQSNAATRRSRGDTRSDGSAANGTTSRPKRDLLGLNSMGGFGFGSSSSNSSPVVSDIFFDTGRPRKTGQAGPRKLQVAGKGKARISAEKQRAALGLDKVKDTGDKVEVKERKPARHFTSESSSSSNVPVTKASVGGSAGGSSFSSSSSTAYHTSPPAPVSKSSVSGSGSGSKTGSSFPSASALRSSGHNLW